MSDLDALMARLGHRFKDPDLLQRAVTHRSFGRDNNERLEFLGDSVLGVIIAGELYQRQPGAREGELSRMRSSLVNGEIIADFSKALGVSDYLRLGSGELKSGGQFRQSILADAFEAIIGALYLDAGMVVCRDCVLQWYAEKFTDLAAFVPKKDPKSALQEWAQGRHLSLPSYQVTTSGKAHDQHFLVICRIEELTHETQGEDSSRRRAEQQAAQKYLGLIKNE